MSETNNVSKQRRSWLQTLILTSLNDAVAPSVTALAERLNRQRPTVSRSLKNLRLAGLVSQNPAGWTLTDAGRVQAHEQGTRFKRSTENMNSAIKRNQELSQIPSLQDHLEQIRYANLHPSFLRQLESVQNGHLQQYEHRASRDIARVNTLADKAALIDASRAAERAHSYFSPAKAAIENERAKIDAAVRVKIPQGVSDAKAMMEKAVGFGEKERAHTSLVADIDILKNIGADQILAHAAGIDAFTNTVADQARIAALPIDHSISKALVADVSHAKELALGIDVNKAAAALDPWKAALGSRQAFIDTAGMDKFMVMNAASVASSASFLKDQATSLSRVIEEASKAQAFVTHISADWIKKAQFADLGILAADRAAISTIINDTLQIGSLLGSARDVARDFTNTTPVLDSYANLADVYGDLHQERMSLIAEMPTLTPQEMYGIILPTTSMQAYGRSVRHYVAAELDADGPAPEKIDDRRLGDYLEPRLRKLDRQLARIWRGIWQVLRSDSEEKVSQATGSACELLRLVLVHLAPDELVPVAHIGKPTRKDRVRYVLGKHSVSDYVEAMARAVEEMYQRLNGFKHHGIHVDLSAICAITACESLILELLLSLERKEP